MALLTKDQWRRSILRDRSAVPSEVHDAEAAALCAQLPGLAVHGATVCAYVPIGSEPGSPRLPDCLLDLGARVLLPVVGHSAVGSPQALRWGEYRPGTLVSGGFGLREPPPPWLPAEAVGDSSVILVPALAVDRAGVRLGRGAGFYDRSLLLARPDARVVAVVRDDELVDRLPQQPHDVLMTHALTPNRGLVGLGAGRESPRAGSGSST